MKTATRVLLVDPRQESRTELEALLSGLGNVWLSEPLSAYPAVGELPRTAIDLLVVGIDSDTDRAVTLIDEVHRNRPDLAVLPASRRRDGDLILRTVRAGAREFLALPSGPDELREAIGRLLKAKTNGAEGQDPSNQILAVTGAAGGIGTTTIAVNLAVALAKDPAREALLLDFDLILGAVDACLDLLPDQTLSDLARSADRLDYTLLKRSLTRHSSGLHVLPSPNSLEEAAKIQPESVRHVLQMLSSVFPTIVIDLGKSLGEVDLIALEHATTILLVVQLEPACIRNSARLLDLMRQTEGLLSKVRIIANRIGSNPHEISLKKAQELLKQPIEWQVVNDFKVFNAARARGVPIEVDSAGCRPHRAILEIARAFSSHADADRPKSRLGRFAASIF